MWKFSKIWENFKKHKFANSETFRDRVKHTKIWDHNFFENFKNVKISGKMFITHKVRDRPRPDNESYKLNYYGNA